jgi:inner membrane protein
LALSCATGFFVYCRMQPALGGAPPVNEPQRALLGARGVACEAFVSGRGKVRIGDSVWLANGPDLAEGTPVVVSAVHGTRLVVDRLAPRPAARSATP